MNRFKLFILLYIQLVCLLPYGCGKFLDEAPNPTLIIPNSISDLQSLLDNYALMNRRFPYSLVVLDDNYYVQTHDLLVLNNSVLVNMYSWKPDDSYIVDWNGIYTGGIIAANTVLDYIDQLTVNPGTQIERDNVRGSALFFRAFWHYSLAELYSQPYFKDSRDSEYGIPIRMTSDINVPTSRLTVGGTYDLIIQDLEEASTILPPNQTKISRPSQAAAFGMLARVYLTMGEYEKANSYAHRCIEESNAQLIDFNLLDQNAIAPIAQFNSEVVFQCVGQATPILANHVARIDTALYSSYREGDLRKAIYYRERDDGTVEFRGDYDGMGTRTGYAFGGIVLDEIYFIRAETAARMNEIEKAMADLNEVMATRWKSSEFVPFGASDQLEALNFIYNERRKSLIFRGTRWSDLRRLQFDPVFSVTPRRIINGVTVELSPGSNRYMVQIPASVINISGIKQNPKDE